MTIETEIEVEKGGGRDSLVEQLDLALTVGGVSIHPGLWRVTLEKVPKSR